MPGTLQKKLNKNMNVLYIFNLILLIIFFYNSEPISKKLGLFKKNSDNTPIVGGLGIYLFFVLCYLNSLFINEQIIFDNISILILMSSIFLVGLIDDILYISYKIRLFLIFIIIFIFLTFNNEYLVKQLYFETLNQTFIINDISYFLTPFFIMLLLNSLNMADGINGNAGFIFLCFFMILFNEKSMLNFFLATIFLSILVFLFFNLKNWLYMGDSGIYFISIFLSLYLINIYNNSLSNLSCEKIFLIFMIPGIDMFRLFCVRIYNKKNPFKGDLNHLHHILMKNLKLSYSLLLYASLILWPFIVLKFTIFNVLYLILLNLIFYFCLIFILNSKKKNQKKV